MRQYIVRAIFTAIIVIFLLLLDYSKGNWETVKDNLYNCNNVHYISMRKKKLLINYSQD